MSSRHFLALCASLLLTPTLSAQLEPDSAPVTLGPLGGSAVSVVVDPTDPDVILVIQYLNGLMRSDDGGLTFDSYGSGVSPLIQDLKQDPNNDSILYVRDGSQLFKSLDFGATWTALGLVAESTIKSYELAPTGDDIVALSRFDSYYSPDGGATWSTTHSVVPFGGSVLGEVTYSSNASIAYMASNDGVQRSNNGGLTWGPLSPFFDEWVKTVSTSPSNPDVVLGSTPFDGMFRSTDGGTNWTAIPDPLTGGSGQFFVREPSGLLWFATLDSLAYSADDGVTWNDGMMGWPTNSPIPLDMAFDSNGQRYFGCEGGGLNDQSGGGLYRMPAGAPTAWTHIGFLVAFINDIEIAGPGGKRIIGIGSGVYAGDEGEIMTPTAWHFDIGTDTRSVAVDPTNPDRWVTGGVGAFFDNAQIVVITDDGDTFAKKYEALGPGVVKDIVFDPNNSNRVVAGISPAAFGNEAIIASNDAGENWIEVAGTAGWANVTLAFDPFNPGVIVQLSENSQWAFSVNGGTDWSSLMPAWPATGIATFLAYDPHNQNVLYRGDDGAMGLWKSVDGGATWNNLGISQNPNSRILFHPDQPNLFWVSDGVGNVLVSDDGGATFKVALDVPLDVNAGPMALDTSDGTLMVGTIGSAVWEFPDAMPVLFIGDGTPGTGGEVPRLSLGGGLPQVGNAGFALAGDNLVGGSIAVIGLGFSEVSLPIFGGIFAVGSPFYRFKVAGGAPGVAGAGSFTRNFPLPNDVSLVGAKLYSQLIVIDAGAADPSGASLSNPLSIRFHN